MAKSPWELEVVEVVDDQVRAGTDKPAQLDEFLRKQSSEHIVKTRPSRQMAESRRARCGSKR